MMVNRQVSRIKLNNCWRLTGAKILLGFFWVRLGKGQICSHVRLSHILKSCSFSVFEEVRGLSVSKSLSDMLKDKYSVGICYIVIYSIYMFVWIIYVHHFSFYLM